MLDIDQTELIGFFEVLPTEQDPQDEEFFGTTTFDIHQDELHLSISFSMHLEDCSLYLKAKHSKAPFFQLYLRDVREVKLKRDKPGSTPALRIIARGEDETDQDSVVVVHVEVQPSIRVRVRNCLEGFT